MKQNDWIVASINNPDFTSDDFKNIADLSIDNTLLLPVEKYLESDLIKLNELFKDKEGNFDEDKFKEFYKNKSKEFNNFAIESSLDSEDFNIWDVRRTVDSDIKNPNFSFIEFPNPDRVSIGIEGRNVRSEREKSVSELALSLKIFDSKTGKFLDETPNDSALIGGNKNPFKSIFNYFSSLFEDPLVIAKWHEDGFHEENGLQVKHFKGLYKINDEGTYYTETLNGRSPIGLDFVSALDTVTVDGSGANKYDFFDADGLDKSATGSIIKNLALVAPLAFLGPVGTTVYGGLFVAKELGKALPMLADVVTLFGDNVDSKLLNTIAGYGNKFTGSTSEYSKNHLFSFENIGNLISDVALQWGQQKAIVKTINSLKGGSTKVIGDAYAKAANEYVEQSKNMLLKGLNGKIAEDKVFANIGTKNFQKLGEEMIQTGNWQNTPIGKAAIQKFLPAAEQIVQKRNKLGQDLSLAYMALISNTDVYQELVDNGIKQKEAAAVALGSMLGMFAVDKFAHLGEIFFDDSKVAETVGFRKSLLKSADELQTKIKEIGKEVKQASPQNKLQKLLKLGSDSSKKFIKDYQLGLKDHTLGFFGKAAGEGLEEVSEEVVTDLTKSLAEIAGDFGIFFSLDDYGSWENAGARYLMSFLGGSIGGGLFYGVDVLNNPKTFNDKKVEQELTYLIRNGKKQELLNELENLHNKGQLGDKNLSVVTDEKNDYSFVSADEDHMSQNDFVYNRIKDSINQLDAIINENQMNLSEDALFDKMVMSESRYLKLKDYLQDASYLTGYLLHFQDLISEIKEVTNEISKYQKDSVSPEDQVKLSELEEKKKNLLEERDKFINGEYSLKYTDKMLFAIDTGLNYPFINVNFDQWLRYNYGKSKENLTEAELQSYSELYDKYVKQGRKKSLDEAYDVYVLMRDALSKPILDLNNEDVESWQKVRETIEKTNPFNKMLSYEDRLDDESDEEFNYRNDLKEGESDTDFNERVRIRQEHITLKNNDNLHEYYQQFLNANGLIDSNTYRVLADNLSSRKKDIKNAYIKKLFEIPSPKGDTISYDIVKDLKVLQEIKEVLQNVDENGSNKDELLNNIKQIIDNAYLKNIFAEASDKTSTNLEIQDLRSAMGLEWDDDVYLHNLFDYFDLNNKEELPYDLESIMSYDPEFEDLQDDLSISIDESNYEPWLEDYKHFILRGALNNLLALGEIDAETYKQSLAKIPEVNVDKLVALSENTVQEIADSYKEILGLQLLDIIKDVIIEGVEKDPWIKTLNDLKKKISVDANPVLKVLDIINSQIGNDDKSLELTLQDILENYENVENKNDFTLSDVQVKKLQEASDLLKYAQAFLYGASTTSNYNNVVGHNKALNEFIQNHSEAFKDAELLPELSENVANLFNFELAKYQEEAQGWINKSLKNQVDKEKKYIKAEEASIEARLKFYDSNKFVTSDGVDLLEGSDKITNDRSLNNLFLLNNLLYQNFLKAISEGHDPKKMITDILKKITHIENIPELVTANLDENLTYNDFTDYDKFLLFINIIAVSDTEWYTKLKKDIENNNSIVPLSILLYDERIIYAQKKNPELVNLALEIVNENSSQQMPMLLNTVIHTGVGGAGKTQVVVKSSVNDLDEAKLIISGPQQTLIETLNEIFKKALTKSIDDLIKMFIDSSTYSELTNSINNNTFNDKIQTVKNNSNGTTMTILSDLDVKKVEGIDTIIIDETTHLSSILLQILSQGAKKSGIQLILAGDDNQRGFEGKGLNIDRETILAWRTPRLSISLRDSTIQKIKNLKDVLNLLEYLRTSTNITPEYSELLYSNFIPNIQLKYYLKDTEFNGDMITKSLDSSTINAIKTLTQAIYDKSKNERDLRVGYVGDEDDTYKKLVNAGLNVVRLDSNHILGQEFNYVVINKNWEKPDPDNTSFHGYRFLQDLYTMMSRSKLGTVFIDNGLSNIIKTKQELISIKTTPILNSLEKFKQYYLDSIASLDLSPLEVFKGKESKTDEVKTEEEIESKKDEKSESEEKSEEEKSEEETEETEETSKEESEEGTEEESEEETNSSKEPDESKRYDDGSAPVFDENEEEHKKLNKEQKDFYYEKYNKSFPVRFYSNVHLLGILSTEIEVEGKKTNEWENVNNSRRDVGIFLRPGKKVVDPDEKDNLVKNVLFLKAALVFGNNLEYYDRLPIDIKRNFFTKEALQKARYYVHVSDNDDLIGMTNLSINKLKVKDKVLSIVCKIEGRDGNIYTLSLGNLANPETWKTNEELIKAALKAKLKEEPNEDLQYYYDNIGNIITNYDKRLDLIIASGKEYTLIKKPQFTGMTDLIFKDPDGNKLNFRRLEDIDSSFSPWINENKYAVTSTVRINTRPEGMPGTKMKVGATFRYVSSNPLLNPEELETLYFKLREDKGIPQVRLDVLKNEGVSFNSLFDRNYMDIYNIHVGKGFYTFPFSIQAMAYRMYQSIWNFRANLKKFNKAVEEWEQANGITNLELLIKLDRQAYVKYRGKLEYLSEDAYRKLASKDEHIDEIKKVWDFNDSLSDSIRLFRLGYNDDNGVWIRKITNLSADNPFYKDTSDVNGIYITKSMATLYESVLDALFDKVINKIIPPFSENTTVWIDPEKGENWYNKLETNKSLTIRMYDNGKYIDSDIKMPPMDLLKLLPIVLTLVAKYLQWYSANKEPFSRMFYGYDEEGENVDSKPHFEVKINDESIDYLKIEEGLEGGIIQRSEVAPTEPIAGYHKHTSVIDGKEVTTYSDYRISNLFDLMFHGRIVGKANKFKPSDFYSTDAYFKFGFFADPIKFKSDGIRKTALVASNNKLFSSDINIGFPINYVSLDEASESDYGKPDYELMSKEDAINIINNKTLVVPSKSWDEIFESNPNELKDREIIQDNKLIQLFEIGNILGYLPNMNSLLEIDGKKSISFDDWEKVIEKCENSNFNNPIELLEFLENEVNPKSTLSEYLSQINTIYTNFGLDTLSKKRLKNINTINDLINLVNEDFNDKIVLYFNNPDDRSIFNLPEEIIVNSETNELLVKMFKDRPEFLNISLDIEESWKDDTNVKQIKYTSLEDSNKKMILTIQLLSNGEFVFENSLNNEIMKTEETEITPEQYLNNLILYLQAFKDSVVFTDGLYTFEETIVQLKELFKDHLRESIMSDETKRSILDDFSKNCFELDDSDPEYNNAVLEIKSALEKLKNPDCAI